ncbi:hypothetical protein AB1N83_009811 [Pleurotus pulmonarius]
MQFTFKFAALAFLAQVAVIAAFPLEQGYDNDIEARGPAKRPTQQECECVAGNYPTPPPSPQNRPVQQARPAVRPAPRIKAGKRDFEDLEARGPTKRPTQQECEVASGKRELENLEARGPTKRPTQQECECVAGNYPTPPPSPQNRPVQQARPAVRPAPRIKAGKRENEDLEARGPTKRPTQQECEVACTLAGFQGQAWNQPAQQAKTAVRPAPRIKAGKREAEDLEARGPTKRPTQQECECVAGNYPTPPPSPQNRPVQQVKPAVRPAPRIKAGKREVEDGDEE